jgi:hypothetical protein
MDLKSILQNDERLFSANELEAARAMFYKHLKMMWNVGYGRTITELLETERRLKKADKDGDLDEIKHLMEERELLLQWATCLNIRHRLGLHEHEKAIQVEVTFGQHTAKCQIYISKLRWSLALVTELVREEIITRLRTVDEYALMSREEIFRNLSFNIRRFQ